MPCEDFRCFSSFVALTHLLDIPLMRRVASCIWHVCISVIEMSTFVSFVGTHTSKS